MFGSDSRILVVEYFCAGGGAGGGESALLPEARTMAAAVLEDFARLPGVRVLTLHRPEIPFHLPAPHEARAVGRSGFGAAFGRALRACDAALVVAPERGRILERLTRSIECAGVVNLGASSAAVRIASDKWSTYRVLARAGVPQPPTICIAACGTVDPELVERRLNRGASTLVVERRRPSLRRSRWILKPLDGYACLGLRAVDAGSDLGAAMRGVRTQTRRARILLQQECSGVDASVSLIGDGRHAVPICLNRQIISREGTFEYSGGVVPLEHH
ncbi:MAG: ATP-grasp domain-containing protein, partial [Acidobacteriota bacterium]